MRKFDAIAFYGTQAKLAEVLGITDSAVSQWGELVPPRQALTLWKLSGGRLQPDYPLPDRVDPAPGEAAA